ncbi:MAG: hypothetical protein AB7S69_12285 [Salinivirgaceae bacterium]|jgi:hypothetical protein
METLVFNIITFIILGVAFFIAGKKLVLKLFARNQRSCADGCSGCTSKCELKSLVDTQKLTSQ